MGDLEGFPEPLWFTPDGIANVLSLANVRKYFEVEYRVEGGNVMFVVNIPSRKITFKDHVTAYITMILKGEERRCR